MARGLRKREGEVVPGRIEVRQLDEVRSVEVIPVSRPGTTSLMLHPSPVQSGKTRAIDEQSDGTSTGRIE